MISDYTNLYKDYYLETVTNSDALSVLYDVIKSMLYKNMCVVGTRSSVYTRVAIVFHDDVIELKHFPRHWPYVWAMQRSPVNSPHDLTKACDAEPWCFVWSAREQKA